MNLRQSADAMLPRLEDELARQIARLESTRTHEMYEMLTYHMGWSGAHTPLASSGKRIRPLLLLLVYAAMREDWTLALPAAAGIEIVHNFSLVHDDIQDNSPTRRGRPALWTKYGTAMAINAGDALFTIAHLSILDVRKSFGAELATTCATIMQQACLDLTAGQFMDLAYQRRSGLALEDYWSMIEGKTAALLAAGAQVGALLASGDQARADRFHAFARLLGLAFQVQDDILGIWGEEALTGKSAASDLVEGKGSLPVLYALDREPLFAKRWLAAPVKPDEVPDLAKLLKSAGAYDYAMQQCSRLTVEALSALEVAEPRAEARAALVELADQLLKRSQ
jgi:geranylgeranyl diphosphate synthase type I